MPVEGPARWTSTTTIGSSTITARFIASAFKAMPGPLDAVTAMEGIGPTRKGWKPSICAVRP